MRAELKIEPTAEISATLTMSATLSEWKALQEQLVAKWPSSDLSHAITELVGDVNKRAFWRKEA